jgi:NAD(P)-dependent dehydrogenase (short-subunit alcohol dehydrogenase family)
MVMVSNPHPSVVITGVSSGIGLALAEDLLARGYRVFGSVRRAQDARALTAAWPGAFVPLVFDVTDEAALPRVVAQVAAAVGDQGLQALINNAGVAHNGPVAHQPMAEIRQLFEVNVFGLMMVTRAFLPLLGARPGCPHPPGRVVNMGSLSGGITVPFITAYSCTKHAVEAYSQGLRRELLGYGIEVATVEPGMIRTPLLEKSAQAQPMAQYADTDIAPAWQLFNQRLRVDEAQARSPEIVCRAVRHAIQAKRPRTRYPLDPLWRIGRILPDRWFDKLLCKVFGFRPDNMLRR